MNRTGSIPGALRRRLAAMALGILLGAVSAAGQLLEVPEPVPSPDGDTSFVGSVSVGFPELPSSQRGRIYYTTNGTDPNAMNSREYDYDAPIVITSTTTLKSARYRNLVWSPVHTARFVKRKLPAPVIAYEGSASFAGSKKVTVTVSGLTPIPATAPKILYSTDASEPDSAYPAAGLTLSKSCVLKVSATHADYDPSPVSSAGFTLLEQVAKPELTPSGGVFQTKTLTVAFRSNTPGAFFQWSLGANSNPDTASPSNSNSAVLIGNTPGEEIVLRVIAKQTQPLMANSAVVEARYVYRPLPDPPVATPGATPFYDVITVGLHSPTPGTVIHYTLDGLTLPTRNTPLYDTARKLTFDSTVTLKASAFRESDVSNTFTGTYILNLTAPVASQPTQEFVDSIQVALSAKSPTAQILYTLNGQDPDLESTPYIPADQPFLAFHDDVTLKAIAVKAGVMSPVATYQYLKKAEIKTTAAPILEPTGRDFRDRQTVTITAEAGAAISYSLDGGPYLPYSGPLTLSATTVLRTTAKKGDLAASAVRTETYVLVPSPPLADPAGGEYSNRLAVVLSPKTPGSQILYSLEPGNFVPELALPYDKPLVFSAGTASTTQILQAAAVLGVGEYKRMSPVVTLEYTIFPSNPNDTLSPGQQRDLSQGIALVNQGAVPILAKVGSVDQLALSGFKDATHFVNLSATAGQGAVIVAFTRAAGKSQAIYRMVSGRPEFVGAGTTVSVSQPGTYLAAVDIETPTLALQEQSAGDSTRVVLVLRDNVARIACSVTGSGLAPAGLTLHPDPDGIVKFNLKNPPGAPRTLWFRAVASDGVNQASFPASGNGYTAVQAWSNLESPRIWTLGTPVMPYEMVGFPVGGNSGLTWKQIRSENQDANLTAYLFKNNDYSQLQDSMRIQPGMAYWLGSRDARVTSVRLSKFQSQASDPDGRFYVRLIPGWNFISNPSLETLYWPVRADARYDSTNPIRAPWIYDHGVLNYVREDSLVPWQGYWVLNTDSYEQRVELLKSRPLPVPKAAAGSDRRLEIQLDYGRPATLRLGAATYALDGVGMEDEPVMPAALSPPSARPTRDGWSVRNGRRLMTDLLRLSGEVMRWTVVLEGAPAAGRDSLVKVTESALPSGYEAWAWSRRRNLKVRLETGAAYSLPGDEPDTLLVLAGPAAKLANLPELAKAVEKVAAFSSRAANGRNGPRLLLALPTDAVVEAGLWSASGRRLAVIHSGRLGSGQHALAIPRPEASRNFAVIRLTARGPGWREARSHRIDF